MQYEAGIRLNLFDRKARPDGTLYWIELNNLLVTKRVTAEMLRCTTSTLQFYAGIINLANANYASMLIVNAKGFGGHEARYYYPGSPRNFFWGIQFSFWEYLLALSK